jgi:O-antigen/teichoic acid export membrane protein
MLVSLYTVRVVLNTLGAQDYGIYNVVGGVVVMFSFLNSAMTSATQRFLNFAMGQGDIEQTRNVYSISFIIHILIAILVIILAETIGLWFFYTWINLPPERQSAALVVYQFSIVVTVINILQIPYQATIIAYEKMSFFAFLSIIESILKLGIVFLLPIILFDRLIIYSLLVSISGIAIFFVYKIYCNRTFVTSCFRYCKDKYLFRQLIGFSGWSIFGGVATVSRNQGINILINIFYGVTVNAAMGIAMQVNAAVYKFVENFQLAFKPQIIKSYAAENYNYFMSLLFRTSKLSFYLLFFFALPLYINANFVLRIWLKNVPEYTVIFTRLILLFSLIDVMSGSLYASIQATGDIKKYQAIGCCFIFANIPLSLLFLKMGFSPVWVLIVKVGLGFFMFVWRIFFVMKRINILILDYLREVIIPILIVTVISICVTGFLHNLNDNLLKLMMSCIISSLSIACSVYLIGLSSHERNQLQIWIKNKFKNSMKICHNKQ